MNVLKLKKLIEVTQPSKNQPTGLGLVDNNPQQEPEWTVEEKRRALESIGRYNEHG